MITNLVLMDDHKLLQELNLTVSTAFGGAHHVPHLIQIRSSQL